MIVLAPDFMKKYSKKAPQDFHRAFSKVFDRVKSVALWSANIRKLAKDHIRATTGHYRIATLSARAGSANIFVYNSTVHIPDSFKLVELGISWSTQNWWWKKKECS